jgi:hypothetical protein
MVRFGTNANPGKSYTVDDIKEMGAEWVRTILYAEYVAQEDDALNPFLQWEQACFDRGIEVVPIIVASSFDNWLEGQSRADLQAGADRHAALLKKTHVQRVFVGNEPNGGACPPSWCMNSTDFIELLAAYSTALPDLEIISGCSAGDASWYNGCLRKLLTSGGRVRAAGIDPYQGLPETGWHGFEGDGWVSIEAKIDDFFSHVRRRIVIGEIGLASDLHDPAGGVGEDEQAAYIHDLLIAISKLSSRRVSLAAIFCQGDDDVPTLGLQRADGSKKPSYFAYQQAMQEIHAG